MENIMKSIYNPAGGETIKVLLECSDTNGEYTKVEVTAPKMCGGPPSHFHKDYDETFTVLEGTLYGKNNGKKITLKPGESHKFEKGLVHSWWTKDEDVKFEMVTTPGFDGFHEGLNILQNMESDGLLNDKGMPKSVRQLATISDIMATRLRGALTPVGWIVNWLANTKKGKILELELRNKYNH